MKKLSTIAAVVFTTLLISSCENQEIVPTEFADAPQSSQTLTAESQELVKQQARKEYRQKVNDLMPLVDIEKAATTAHD
jgi:ABC-type transporter MlaC component